MGSSLHWVSLFRSFVPQILLYTGHHFAEYSPHERQHYKLAGHIDMVLLYQQGLDLPAVTRMWAPCLHGTRITRAGAAVLEV